ncbi:indolepyruvate ferredoxin oxidoreductase family protein [Bradyrhizobium sp. AUGA SZCCT0431]|uniref:indolepyruvate ferredoxin oxidoreductase family protein n=1 Tax=Bradyrhizobium sp. AUGA SZCCT0431 TaxID=2807674 RepID=UPI001BAD2BC3|nr:indolepyruvate ferredoxin oxidoreductase family protein [Bradyrhizobium sp. AUGA SZCCT0431]MBR1147901.1 indolepyruvate ferredoxin oxidoreductase family protein [Bradyrhizobium sp. AUGA SZCCT0431]
MTQTLTTGRDLDDYALMDRYTRETGRVLLTGTQALVRILLDQRDRDRADGINSAGFVSGYRGSPLGGVDLELWRAKKFLSERRIEFLPAVNEDLAATAVLGSQQVETNPAREVDGVFGLWYGKGPGVDRSGDALKHGNAYGSSPHGGVLVVAGDDHGCVSSSMPHQSDVAFMAWFMPTLSPSSVAEYLSFGEYGYALSRFSGMWVGFKAISETVESCASVELPPRRLFNPPAFEPPAGGLHYRWPDLPGPQIEQRLEAKKNAVLAFAAANPIDRRIYDIPDATYGIVTTGKAHLDLMEALQLLGLTESECRRLGIDIYKVGMVWPLAHHDALEFVREKREILVIEEKRGIIESQFKEYFYDYPGHKPEHMAGKSDENNDPLVPWVGELSPRLLAPIVAKRLDLIFPGLDLTSRAEKLLRPSAEIINISGATRTPYFCSGCPHNTSTKVPEGSQALAGIGCHFMASWMDRDTSSLIQMGGEGVNWIASSRFTGGKHVFQNLGEGTYYHSGSMAIRQAVAAKANITYKILFNDAVAMTGGQPVDGPISVTAIAHEVRANGVTRIAIVSDAPDKLHASDFPNGVTIHPRAQLDAVQRELRQIAGVSVLIYEQECATERRRKRKRGQAPELKKFAVINDLVCEGCGDCSVESNCLSVEPKETPFGRKRQINLSTCNQDFSCVNGFCPSFVTVEGATRRKKQGAGIDAMVRAKALSEPNFVSLENPFNLLVTGVGGTGVITVGALITMAAHLEGKGASVLDFTGFAQKFGPVLSFIRLSNNPDDIHQVRIDQGAANALIGCDIVVSSSPKASGTYGPGMRAVINTAEMPTGDIVRNRDASLEAVARLRHLERVVGSDNFRSLDANRLSDALFGDTVFANVIMLGAAWQQGLVPVTLEALMRAIELNGVAIEQNKQAFASGRLAAADRDFVTSLLGQTKKEETLDQVISRRVDFLTAYQDAAYADRYLKFVGQVRAAEERHVPGSQALTTAVARSLFKLMAYKDEYEVARLHMETGFQEKLRQEFEGDFAIKYHLAPPVLSSGKDARGRPLKRQFGQWIQTPFRILARLKFLRGTALDVFGHTHERQMERGLIDWYEKLMTDLAPWISPDTIERLVKIAAAPMDIRGYGPVKTEAVAKVQKETEDLLRLLKSSTPESRAA